MKIFFIIFISLFTYLNYLIGRYYTSAFSLTGRASTIFWVLHGLGTLTMLAAPYIYRMYPVKEPGFWYNALQWTGYTFFGIYSVVLIFMFLNLSGLWVYNKIVDPSPERRLFLRSIFAFASIGVTGVVTSVGLYEARKKPEVKKVKIPIDELPSEFEGIKILQMSDIHVGQTIRRDFVETLVEMSNEIRPDMVVLTGDMVDGIREQLADELLSFRKIIAPLGKFLVPGNHEYYWGVGSWMSYWQEIGFSPLLNQHKVVEKNGAQLVMAGVHDYSSRHSDGTVSSPVDSLKGSPLSAVKILLAHQPRSVYQAAKAGFHLQLSGHTHSGQYFPYNLLIYFFQPFVKGLNRFEKTWIYVNQGTGYWGPPSRFGVPPEITLIELTKGPVA
jgi:predicted MPP superfamily phosphohydrolase